MRCFIYRLTYAVVKVLLNTASINLSADPAGVQRLFNHSPNQLLMFIKILVQPSYERKLESFFSTII
jgi:hypothetical protein